MESLFVEVTRARGRGRCPRAEGFRARSAEQGEWWDVLLGIPASAPVRELSLSVRIKAGQRSCLFLQPLAVTERAFFSERIPFNRDLTRLMTIP